MIVRYIERKYGSMSWDPSHGPYNTWGPMIEIKEDYEIGEGDYRIFASPKTMRHYRRSDINRVVRATQEPPIFL